MKTINRELLIWPTKSIQIPPYDTMPVTQHIADGPPRKK